MSQFLEFNPITKTIALLESRRVTFYNIQSKILKEIVLKEIPFESNVVKHFIISGENDTIELCHEEDGCVYYSKFDIEGKRFFKKLLSTTNREILMGLNKNNIITVLFNNERDFYEGPYHVFKGCGKYISFDLDDFVVSKRDGAWSV